MQIIGIENADLSLSLVMTLTLCLGYVATNTPFWRLILSKMNKIKLHIRRNSDWNLDNSWGQSHFRNKHEMCACAFAGNSCWFGSLTAKTRHCKIVKTYLNGLC